MKVLKPVQRLPNPPIIDMSALFAQVRIALNKQPSEQQVKDLMGLTKAFSKEIDKIMA